MIRKRHFVTLPVALLLVVGCGGGAEEGGTETSPQESAMSEDGNSLAPILATNAFYYYENVEAAWEFYTRTLGFETVADYGFAKMLRVSPTSYLTLVDQERGMHDSSEPKSVTLAIVTEEVEAWWEYLNGQGVQMRGEFGPVEEGRPHDGFVAIDPEGYLLEFERFNPHAENTDLMPVLDQVQALYPTPGQETAPGITTTRPADLGVQATVLWLYYDDIDAMASFYEAIFGHGIIVDQGWATVFPTSPTGFLGFVDGSRGLHQATEEKAVTVSFFTGELMGWFEHTQTIEGFSLRTEEISSEGDFVHTFVGYDPEGYFLEWDTFLDVDSNDRLLALIQDSPSGH